MTPELVSAWSSIAIALMALAVTIWQGYLTRTHNRVSLRPHLTFQHKLSDSDPRFQLDIQNNGVGPAEITKFQVLLDGKAQDHFEAPSWLAILDTIGLQGRACGATYDPGEFIAANQTLQLLKVECGRNPVTIRQVRQAMQRVTVHVSYKSIYGDSHEARFDMPPSIFDCFEGNQ